jgi:hypothetical protein
MADTNLIITKLVTKNDTAENWATNDPVLLKGEQGIDTTNWKIRIGDGISKWSELSDYGLSESEVQAMIKRDDYYELIITKEETLAETIVTDNDKLATITEPKQGDVAVVKKYLTTDASGNDKYTYTGYVYDNNVWGAMDGNYDAENVYFDSDIAITTAVGNITLSNGQGTIPAAGKNMKQVFEAIWTKENTDPTVTNPSCSITMNSLTADASYEVGETVAISYTTSFSAGSYQFGPATGVTVKSYTVSNGTVADNKDTSTGSFDTITMADANDASKDEYSSYRLSVTAGHTAATAVAKSNLGNNTSKTIAEGNTTTAYSKYVKSYRKPFWGYKLSADALSDPTKITSDQVRGLQESGTSQGGVPTSYTVPADTKQVYFVVEAGTKNTINVKNASSLNAPVAFTKVASGVQVEGANNYKATAYDLWYANFDNATTGSAELTISWT